MIIDEDWLWRNAGGYRITGWEQVVKCSDIRHKNHALLIITSHLRPCAKKRLLRHLAQAVCSQSAS